MVNATLNCTLVFRNFTTKLAAFSGWTLARTQTALAEANAVRLSLDDRQAGSQVTFGDVNVDGSVAMGPFDPGPGAATTWLGTGYDFAAPNGFTTSRARCASVARSARVTHTCGLAITFGHFHAAEPAAGGSGSMQPTRRGSSVTRSRRVAPSRTPMATRSRSPAWETEH